MCKAQYTDIEEDLNRRSHTVDSQTKHIKLSFVSPLHEHMQPKRTYSAVHVWRTKEEYV